MPDYTLRESMRAKYVRIQVDANGEVMVTKPKRASLRSVEQFVKTRQAWIEDAQRKASKRRGGLPLVELPRPRKGSRAYEEARKAARALAT